MSLSFHVSQSLNDLSVPDAHDVYPSDPVRSALAPTKLPADNPAVLAGPDFLGFEDKVRGRCDPFLEIEAGLAPFVARAIRCRSGIFKNAAFADQIVEVFGAMSFEGIVETGDDFARGFAVGIHIFTS